MRRRQRFFEETDDAEGTSARVSDGAACLARDERSADDVQKHERIGQPLGDDLLRDRVARLRGMLVP